MTDAYVVLLGTKGGPAIRTGSANPTSSLVVLDGQRIVVDCGLGVTRGLVDAGVKLSELATIFVTHLHSDHYLELGPLLHTAWTAGLKTPVTIYGPKGLQDYLDGFMASMKADIDLRQSDEGRPNLGNLISYRPYDEGPVTAVGTVRVAAIRNIHPPLVDTFALRFDGAAKSVCFSGDTAFHLPLADFAAGADLLVHEAMLDEALEALVARVGNGDDRLMFHLKRSHTVARDAGRIATQAGVRALALHHLVPLDDPDYTETHWREAVAETYQGHLYVGRDGLRIHL